MITLTRTDAGPVVSIDGKMALLSDIDWDTLFNSSNLVTLLKELAISGEEFSLDGAAILAPIGTQEVWAAGVTYYRSRDARMEESKASGGQDFYAKVYSAERPELFMKASAFRVVGPGASVRIRQDSKWNVPEPELTLAINSRGEIIGYTIGNDMSSRDIEGENPLYLPQAKVYDGSCAIGPCILIRESDLSQETTIDLTIERDGEKVFSGHTDLHQLKRTPEELVSYLYRETTFPTGALLMTGTGIIPGTDFTLISGDLVTIKIESIGVLRNVVA